MGPRYNVNLLLNTVYGQTEIAVKKIEGLVVQHVNKAEAPIALPKTYSRDVMPSNRSQIPTPEAVSKWLHLARIKDQLLPLQKDIGSRDSHRMQVSKGNSNLVTSSWEKRKIRTL